MAKFQRTPKSLAHGRPTSLLARSTATPSSRATRTLIRSHHTLQKRHARAVSRGDTALAATLQQQLAAQGGLAAYQAASKTGQSAHRGGDASKLLVQWLEPMLRENASGRTLRALDVGALTTQTALAAQKNVAVTAIDLMSQESGIVRQDFMARPLPKENVEQKFDLVCLSLVLNYVAEPQARGEMLKRVREFLLLPGKEEKSQVLPALFLVLPAPCVTNSRYLDGKRLDQIMQSLGFEMVHRKISAKLAYYLWKWNGTTQDSSEPFTKAEVSIGRTRNNFAIVLE